MTLDDTKSRELCLNLLRCETEEEVIEVLKRSGFWSDRDSWRAYGDIQNNRGVVGNQQSSPVAALVEKLVNSIDAILVYEALSQGIDPTGPDAPATMLQAAEDLLGIPGGKLERLTASERTQLAERIQLIACGTKSQPAYMVVDDGEGQAPDAFPATFLSLLRDNKIRIPFVQGKYNMGGTGVLQFSGTNSFQLVISRRQPELAGANGEADSNRWGFTLVRRVDPDANQPQSTYVYLAPEGKILSFRGRPIEALPGSYPELYREPLDAGTVLKLWNYRLPGGLKTIATLDLRRELEEFLQDPVIPIRIRERRVGYRANYYDTTMSGLLTLLAESAERIEPGFDTGATLNIPNVGSVVLRLIVSREEGTSKLPAGIFFNVNGQLHGQLSSEFVSRRTKFDYIASNILVIADCTSLPPRIREDLFLASRDRMRQCDERYALEDSILSFLKDHPGLRQLNNDRRQARLAARLTGDEPQRIVQTLARSDPTLAAILGKGGRIAVPGTQPVPPEPYVGKEFPTYVRLLREPKGGLVRQCPKNRTCRIEYETDAVNDYLSRATNPGRLSVSGSPVLLSSNLWNGKLTLRFSPPPAANVGDTLFISTEVMDVNRDAPLSSRFGIQVEPDAPPEPPGGPTRPPGANLLSMPNIVEVRRDKWAECSFDENSAIQIRSGEDETLDFYINMDNINLRNEIAKRRDKDPKLLEYWFKYGIFLSALGMVYRLRISKPKVENGGGEVPEGIDYGIVEIACQGVAVTLVPTIVQLGAGIPSDQAG